MLEVCVEDPEGVQAAVLGGADRIELCSALGVGGLTPSAGFMKWAAGCGVPVFAMIRPRAGGFVYGTAEVAMMRADISAARAAGLAGVVLGATKPDGMPDEGLLRLLIADAGGMGLTLHRAFDLCPDKAAGLETAVTLGFQRILTSGGAVTAERGLAVLDRLFALAGGRIGIMPGAGITAATVAALRARLPLGEVHSSCSVPVASPPAVAALGFDGPARRRTDAGLVRALKAALADGR